ncbi:hypothetical protein [Roseburia sp. 499]|uniref:hypothetical protein n=1 Tax=Roseburia sp. 499 TaxID=1261634 RepID=UPI00095125C0|nr:hypothetical protein [Roseburia sp. 499]WVK71020.1 hypothetical protein BIV20_05640 [Roseburia sp. 499]
MKITLREEAESKPEVIIIYPQMDDTIKNVIKKIESVDIRFYVIIMVVYTIEAIAFLLYRKFSK